jgi:hypothetical protein
MGFFIVLLVLLAVQPVEAQFTTPPVAVATTPPDSGRSIERNARLFVDASGAIHVAWVQSDSSGPTLQWTLMYSRSRDGGLSFSAAVPVTGEGTEQLALGSLVVNSRGMIFVAGTNFGSGTVFVRLSVDGGQTFPLLTTFGPGGTPSLALDTADNVNLAWGAFTTGGSVVTFSRSIDQGLTFSAPKALTCENPLGCGGGDPLVSVDRAGTIYLIAGLSLVRSIDGGQTFAPGTKFSCTDDTFGGLSSVGFRGLFVETSGAIDILCQRVGQGAPHPAPGAFIRSIDGGQTFSSPVQISFTRSVMEVDPSGNITVLAADRPIAVTRSVEHGATFSAAVPLGLGDSGILDAQVDSKGTTYLLYLAAGDTKLLLTKLIGLLPTLVTTPGPFEVGEVITLRMRVDNLEAEPFTHVFPNLIAVGGSGGAHLLSGPTPAEARIPPGGSQTFDFTFRATSPGMVTFSGSASGTSSTMEQLTTPSTTSAAVQIQGAAALIITSFHAGPTSVIVGGTINVNMTVTNMGTGTANAVTPSPLTLSNSSFAILAAGPSPQTIGGGASATFFWTFTAVNPGLLDFTGSVTGTDALTSTQISSPPAISNPLGIGVAPPAPPWLSIMPTSLTFSVQVGETPAQQSLSITNAGGGRLSWTAAIATSSGGPWLSLALTSATAPSTVQVSVNTDGLSPGNYSGSITVTAPAATGSPQTVTVMLNLAATPQSPGSATNYQDWWWNPSQSGHGVNIGQQGNTIFASWFFYDQTGAGMWLTMAGTLVGNAVTGDLHRTTGPALGMPFNPNQVIRTPVGQATFTFADPNNATLSYTVYGVLGTISLVRFTFAPLPIDGVYLGGDIGVTSGCLNPSNNGSKALEAAFVVSTSGSAIAIQEYQTNNIVCTALGQYAQNGSRISAQGTFGCTSGVGGTWSSNDITILEHAFVARATLQYTVGETCHAEGVFGGLR